MKALQISVIGAGAVGATTAYALMLQNVASDIILVDCNKDRCSGEVFDLEDVLSFTPTASIRGGSLKDAAQADIIVIAAGARQMIGQDRCELFEKNVSIIKAIMRDMQPIRKDAIIIMVSNPVDSLTLCAQAFSGLSRNQVFGTGTFLDTQRLRCMLSNVLGIAEESIEAFILGEHGDTQFPAWSLMHAGGRSLTSFKELTGDVKTDIAKRVMGKAYDIIELKEATFFGIAACVAQLCKIIMFNQQAVVPVSCYQEQSGVCLSVPVVLGSNGIQRYMPVELDAHEQAQLHKSAEALRQFCAKATCVQ